MSDNDRRSGFDQRSKNNRRGASDRRKQNSPGWNLPERRTGKDRRDDETRSGDERREDEFGNPIKPLPSLVKMRTVYLVVNDMEKARSFYSNLFSIEPRKNGNVWCEFKLGNINFGLRINDFGQEFKSSNCVPVFEIMDTEIFDYIKRAKDLGAKMVLDALEDENMLSVVMKDPLGNEFELSKMHDF